MHEGLCVWGGGGQGRGAEEGEGEGKGHSARRACFGLPTKLCLEGRCAGVCVKGGGEGGVDKRGGEYTDCPCHS